MFNSQKFDDIAKKLSDLVPGRIKGLSEDLQKNFRSVLQSSFSKMDLVSREEFDAQAKVLSRTRAMVEELEKKVSTLEAQLQPDIAVTTVEQTPHPNKPTTDIIE